MYVYIYISFHSCICVYIYIPICKKALVYNVSLSLRKLYPPSRFPCFCLDFPCYWEIAVWRPYDNPYDVGMYRNICAVLGSSPLVWYLDTLNNGEFGKEVQLHPPKFNRESPWKPWWLEYYFPIGKVTFQGRTVKFWEGILVKCQEVSLLFCWLKFYILLKGFPEKLYWMHDVGI